MKTVIEMAREAGFPFNKFGLLQGDDSGEIDADQMLEAFAELARADERAKLAEQPAPVPGVVLREGQLTLLRDRDIKTTDVRLCAMKENQS